MKNNKYGIRTDLALEANEEATKEDGKLKGVIVTEEYDRESGVFVTVLKITNKEGEKKIKKPMGTYITIEAEEMSDCDEEYHTRVSEIVTNNIKRLMEDMEGLDKKKNISFMVIGLGNRNVTPDSLGPEVVENINIERDILKDKKVFSAISPGVKAQTGMETASIIKGIVSEEKPDFVIAIDALAARSSKRLNTTIQLSDKGIHPGSGVGNHRVGIVKENIEVPVIAIGVPTVIDAPTIVNDTMENLIRALFSSKEYRVISDMYADLTSVEKYGLIKEVIDPQMVNMYVTPKDIDATVKKIANVIAEGINALF